MTDVTAEMVVMDVTVEMAVTVATDETDVTDETAVTVEAVVMSHLKQLHNDSGFSVLLSKLCLCLYC